MKHITAMLSYIVLTTNGLEEGRIRVWYIYDTGLVLNGISKTIVHLDFMGE